jgi:hypothetical protein
MWIREHYSKNVKKEINVNAKCENEKIFLHLICESNHCFDIIHSIQSSPYLSQLIFLVLKLMNHTNACFYTTMKILCESCMYKGRKEQM